MMKIIYTQPDGTLAIVSPAPQTNVARCIPEVADMTEMQYMEFIAARDIPATATNVHIVDDADIPSDRKSRDKWKANAIKRQDGKSNVTFSGV